MCLLFSSHSFGQWTQKGPDIDGENADDRFGYSVSLSSDGNTFAAGATFNDGNGHEAGHVRVFQWNAVTSDWDQKGADIDGELAADQCGYSVSLSADGNTLAVGAPANDGAGLHSGHIRVYQWNAGSNSWLQKGIDIDGQFPDDQFGWSVSISNDGNTFVGGARYSGSVGVNSGQARVYRWNDLAASWEQMGADINGDIAGSSAGFSTSISADGTIIGVGSPYHNGIGRVKLYRWNAGANAWDQLGASIDGDPTDSQFGYTISLSKNGSLLAIGSKGDCLTGHNSGHTRVYEWNQVTNTWTQKGATINGETAWDLSGYSVSLNALGDALATGAPFNDGIGTDAGHIRVFDWDNGTNSWVQRGPDLDAEVLGDHFGWSVSMSSDGATIASGANANDGNGTNSGHVRVFEYPLFAGVSSLEDGSAMNLFPNPTHGVFNIDPKLLGEIDIRLYDLTGRSVFNKHVWSSGAAIELNVERLEKGNYVVVIDTPQGSTIHSLVKN